MNARKFAACYTVSLLTACAAPYPVVQERATSKVVFRTELPETAFYSPKADRCFPQGGVSHYASIWGAHRAWKIGVLTPPDNPGETPQRSRLDTILDINYTKELNVPSGEEFVFFAQGVTGYSYNTTHYCGLMTGFVPAVGAVYDVLYLRAGRGCNAIIRETIDGEIRSLTEGEIRRYPNCQ